MCKLMCYVGDQQSWQSEGILKNWKLAVKACNRLYVCVCVCVCIYKKLSAELQGAFKISLV